MKFNAEIDNFKVLFKATETLLEDICRAKNPIEMLQKKLEDAKASSEIEGREMYKLIKELEEAEYIEVLWAPVAGEGYPKINMSIETYRERLKQYKAFKKEINASGNVTNNNYNSTHNHFNFRDNNKVQNLNVLNKNNATE